MGDKSNFKGKLCAVIVTHNPDTRITEVVDVCRKQVDFIFIVDNASVSEKRSLVENLNREIFADRIDLTLNDKNIGLPKAYNHAIKRGMECNCESFIFLDQDSILEANSVQKVKSVLSELHISKNIGALNFSNIETKQATSELLISKIHDRNYVKGHLYSDGGIKEVKSLINSGLYITSNVLKQVGFFSEELFVDSVDLDLSFKLRNAGLRMFLVINAKISHNIDSDFITKGLIIARNHNVEREYHIIKDGLTVVKKWYKRYFISCMALLTLIILGILVRMIFLPCRKNRFKIIMNALRNYR